MLSFSGTLLREVDMWGATPIDQMVCRIPFKRSNYQGTYTPSSLHKATITSPGTGGGVDWGSVSVDVDRGIMVVNWMRVPGRQELITRAEAVQRGYKTFDGLGPVPSPEMPMENTPYAAEGGGPFLSQLVALCSVPPWELLSAIDLVTGRVIWNKPLGTAGYGPVRHSVAPSVDDRGAHERRIDHHAERLDLHRGRCRAGNPRGGHLHRRGAVEGSAAGRGQATPMTYQSRSGKQFVLIAAVGKPSLKTRQSSKIVAYALP
jgi:quinoprotein glucose dehydrogenase